MTTVLRITIVNDDTSEVRDIIYTDETFATVRAVLDHGVSTYDSREELDEANADDDDHESDESDFEEDEDE